MRTAPVIKTVLFATEYYPPFAPGGAEWTNAAWASALARHGCRVVVVTPNYGASPREERDGVTIVRVPFPVRLPEGSGETRWLVHRNPLFHRYFARHVAVTARREGVDLIHAQKNGSLLGAWRAARACGLPIVVTVRDLGLLCPLGACTLFEPWTTFDCTRAQYAGRCVPFYLRHYATRHRSLRREALRARLQLGWFNQSRLAAAMQHVNGFLGVSAGILAIHPERLVPSARRRVVYPLCPSGSWPADGEVAEARERLGIPPGPLVLYAGKHSLGKGTAVLLDALAPIRAAVPGVRFAFAGKGEMALPATSDVHGLGPLPQATLFALYRAADVVVVPSIWPEPMSRVIVESMWLGRSVVATAVGGSPEAVQDGVTGSLVPKGDAPALAAAVVALLRDPERRALIGGAASTRAARMFGEESVVASLVDAYESLATRPA